LVQQILRRAAVQRATGLGRSTLYERIAAGAFPKPIPLGGGKAVGWLESDILAWQQARIAERDAAAG
jgi:prophage regulatory protein